ncbi:S53 family peptidase [Rhodoferax sp.]|uniref:S53 family peptidase n=1 Tax=Rhodoferax sp. TaxID=50421 RepID=UPI0025D22DEE|nr:S53 family peptidase [Rhodoferax sp.]
MLVSTPLSRSVARTAAGSLSVLALLALSACGGGSSSDVAATSSAQTLDAVALLADVPTEVLPTFHMAPVDISDPSLVPSDTDAVRTEAVLPAMEGLATARLLPQTVATESVEARRLLASTPASQMSARAASVVTVYTPAQIRAAYKLPAVSAAGVVSTAAARAALGAGQTIYLVDAYHNPNAFADLNNYNARLNLPTCTSVAISPTAALPLAAASPTAGCTFSVVYAAATSGRTSVAPAYNAGWAAEIAMDVESAHAIAPLARIILVEATSASLSALANAITVANTMGSGVVSMSFGAGEGNWTASVDSLFQGKGMQYTASTGDSGAAVNWPAVSTKVLATGGTSLSFNGSTRTETVWSGTGGGTSAYTAVPAYQTALSKTITKRRVADVSSDSDPYTGQYVGITVPGGAFGFMSGGGTSIAAPEWAALLAIASAQRALVNLPVLTSVHNALYLNLLPNASSYSQAFLDVTTGANGSCTTCKATAGYDASTGLGSPNGGALLALLSTIKQ